MRLEWYKCGIVEDGIKIRCGWKKGYTKDDIVRGIMANIMNRPEGMRWSSCEFGHSMSMRRVDRKTVECRSSRRNRWRERGGTRGQICYRPCGVHSGWTSK